MSRRRMRAVDGAPQLLGGVESNVTLLRRYA
jgi:hypothetical protein